MLLSSGVAPILSVAALAATSILGACSSSGNPAGIPVVDAGIPVVDAGLPDVEPPDAGTPDAAPVVEAGLNCGAGSYVNGSTCSACPTGTFSAVTNASACTAWTTCNAGQYVTSTGSASADRACNSCSAGTYSNTTNAVSCTWCGAGTSSSPGATACSVAGTGELNATTAAFTGAGLSDCGVSSSDVCARSLLVTGGTFYRGTDTANPATISDFRLDKYEVTVGRFRKFVDAWVGGWRPATGSGKHTHLNSGSGLTNTAGGYEPGWDATWASYPGAASAAAVAPTGTSPTTVAGWTTNLSCNSFYQTWTSPAGANEKRPQNCLSFYDLHAFCIWDGGFLPSEAEWEYAAAGGSEERIYPWGATVPGTNSTLSVYGCYWNGTGSCTTGVANIAEVGSVTAGNGRWGQSDLAGNVWEWNLDWYNSFATTCNNCANVTASSNRVLRGGSFDLLASSLPAASRYGYYPAYRYFDLGGRCARTAP